jgi:hypothetical protein
MFHKRRMMPHERDVMPCGTHERRMFPYERRMMLHARCMMPHEHRLTPHGPRMILHERCMMSYKRRMMPHERDVMPRERRPTRRRLGARRCRRFYLAPRDASRLIPREAGDWHQGAHFTLVRARRRHVI